MDSKRIDLGPRKADTLCRKRGGRPSHAFNTRDSSTPAKSEPADAE
ncbi:hypothetical protein G3480_14025 [Thiorhodococcus mannitoliphagus]|uniref:Uncharacterized protein n=1 Tax=Thiorhodococcus mannitoliphagus TaxID=329406 RepID=A0A6P1DTH6_9GAMM|nr:hypothetical protein [Thiorhodococcus mannitoliphagus]NEX21418.1 hypothetical protein [Thiorhodococcus mannitoliphagus]